MHLHIRPPHCLRRQPRPRTPVLFVLTVGVCNPPQRLFSPSLRLRLRPDVDVCHLTTLAHAVGQQHHFQRVGPRLRLDLQAVRSVPCAMMSLTPVMSI